MRYTTVVKAWTNSEGEWMNVRVVLGRFQLYDATFVQLCYFVDVHKGMRAKEKCQMTVRFL